ncbi:hypothetical protein CFIO01_07363 [Colletotrichum fioriniae PJ7]|uniref:NB-ARC domain-containing protein n=1 Tax=Colletotrichum fioriniae PJ7 TaxID=1445577 RepID=A0A010RP64_9PEZI|nr:hypothetical protein CFIO01_07363 [Colletotrichum fioriniae PJ7]
MRRLLRKDRRKDRDNNEDLIWEAPLAEGPTAPATMPQPFASESKQPVFSAAAVGSNSSSGHPTGLKILYEPAEGKAVVDIIFVHGLKGHREKTWTAEKASEPWPKTLLPSEIPNARVLAYGYDADVAKATEVVSTNRIRDHAATLLKRLANFRDKTDSVSRFISIPKGGIVCQAALARAHTRDHLREVFDSTRGILFLGTPHHGSALAVWAERLAKSVGVLKQTNTEILGVLKPESEVLAEIQDNFHHITQSQTTAGVRTIQITCFYEELPLPGVGLVVPQHSAIFPGKDAVGIRGNHHTMAKFSSLNDPGFIDICDELRIWVKKVDLDTSVQNKHSTSPLVVQEQAERNPKALEEDQKIAVKFLVPFARNKSFVGRSDVLSRLQSEFCHGPGEDIEDARFRVCLYGLGGIGKTQIAIAYIYWLRKAHPEISVFWVHASNLDRFRQTFSEIADECLIPGRNDPNTDVLTLVKYWFQRQRTSPWFLVLDNADDTDLFFNDDPLSKDSGSSGVELKSGNSNLARFIPQYGNGSILITTRNKKVGSRLVPDQPPLEIGPMSDIESVQMFREISGDSSLSTEAASALSSRLENLPLAIAQASAYMQENSMGIDRYLRILNRGDTAESQLLSKNFDNVDQCTDIPRAVMATWTVSFEEMQKKNSLAGEILSLLAFFNCQAIQRQFLTVYMYLEKSLPEVRNQTEGKSNGLQPTEDCTSRLEEDCKSFDVNEVFHERGCHSKEDNYISKKEHVNENDADIPSLESFSRDEASLIRLEQALGTLKAFSFLRESKNETLDMHRLVQLATAAWLMQKGLAKSFVGKALATMARFCQSDYGRRTLSYKDFPHFQAVLSADAENSTENDSSTFFIRYSMATIYSFMGHLTLALDVSEAMVETQAHNGREEFFFEAIQLRSDILGSLNREQEAKKALAALVAILPQDSFSKFSTVSLLSELCLKLGDYREAKELLVSAIAELEGDDAQSLGQKAFLMIQLSMAIENMDGAMEAQQTFLEASKLAGKLPECSKPSDMAFNNNLARMFISQGRFQEAEILCRQFLPNKLGNAEASNITIEILSTLADAMGKQNRFQEAIDVQRRAVHCIKQVCEPGNEMEAEAFENLGNLQCFQGLFEDAEESMAHAIRLYQDLYGDAGDHVLRCMRYLGLIKDHQCKREETQNIMEKGFLRSVSVFGPEHETTLSFMRYLSFLMADSSESEIVRSETEDESQYSDTAEGK